MNQETYMRRALDLARLAEGDTSPNPGVGAVLVYRDRIIGEGFHAAYGQPHAEVMALRSVRPEDQGFIPDSTLYVTLEPCCVYMTNTPCTDLIIRERIKKVVISCSTKARGLDGQCVLLRDHGRWRLSSISQEENTRHSSAMCQSVNNDLASSCIAFCKDGFVGGV
ncbi:MAG: deaminase [Saprospiraceae bacterium]